MKDLDQRIGNAVRHFWNTRTRQAAKQGKGVGRRDRGSRTAVTGGAQLDGFIDLIKDCLVGNGIPNAAICRTKRVDVILPGFFRPTKEWDLLVVVGGELLAVIEAKSQVGSFGNNFNNRVEESIGNATDILKAYREGAFQPSAKPWVGYFMLLEDAPGSRSPVLIKEPHFKVFKEFRGTSYAKRYELFCRRLIRERLYDAAAIILSDKKNGSKGVYQEPSAEVSFHKFIRSLTATAIAYAKSREG